MPVGQSQSPQLVYASSCAGVYRLTLDEHDADQLWENVRKLCEKLWDFLLSAKRRLRKRGGSAVGDGSVHHFRGREAITGKDNKMGLVFHLSNSVTGNSKSESPRALNIDRTFPFVISFNDNAKGSVSFTAALRIKRRKVREVKPVDQRHPSGKWHRWSVSSGLLAEPTALLLHTFLPPKHSCGVCHDSCPSTSTDPLPSERSWVLLRTKRENQISARELRVLQNNEKDWYEIRQDQSGF